MVISVITELEEVKGYLKCEDETDDKLIEFFDRMIPLDEFSGKI